MALAPRLRRRRFHSSPRCVRLSRGKMQNAQERWRIPAHSARICFACCLFCAKTSGGRFSPATQEKGPRTGNVRRTNCNVRRTGRPPPRATATTVRRTLPFVRRTFPPRRRTKGKTKGRLPVGADLFSMQLSYRPCGCSPSLGGTAGGTAASGAVGAGGVTGAAGVSGCTGATGA